MAWLSAAIGPCCISSRRQPRGRANRRDARKRLAKHHHAVRVLARHAATVPLRIDPQRVFPGIRLAVFEGHIRSALPIGGAKDLRGWRCWRISGEKHRGPGGKCECELCCDEKQKSGAKVKERHEELYRTREEKVNAGSAGSEVGGWPDRSLCSRNPTH